MVDDEALTTPRLGYAEVIQEEDATPSVGAWYWVKSTPDGWITKGTDWLGCVVHVGSNYALLKGVFNSSHEEISQRVHFDEFSETCTSEPNADAVIAGKVEGHRQEAQRLMGEVRAITGRLAVTTGVLGSGTGGEALAISSGTAPVAEYKEALVLAKRETLPDLFKKIEAENKMMGRWMTANLFPIKAEAEGMRPLIKAIERRIFSVELYAGLTEEVVQVSGGKPASTGEKIHLFQRRAYMDEECLARYEVGGMEFKDIYAFDAWLARPANRDRLLPFPRSVVAFRVRRNEKEREAHNFRDFFRILGEVDLDKLTFLYVRNGHQLHRLSTEIDFGARLFPNQERADQSGRLWGKVSCGNSTLISLGEYEALQAKEEEARKKYEEAPKEERWHFTYHGDRADSYRLFDRGTVYYDDFTETLERTAAEHNRLVLVLQGLLDRSPVFHPHPPWQLWTPEGFSSALELVYDDARALTPGEAPDFEAYRSRLNATLKAGSVTVGQEDAWLRHEARKQNRRLTNDYRYRGDANYVRFKPQGDPGPGELARVRTVRRRAGTATWDWLRPRASESWNSHARREIKAAFTCPISEILNADAYLPGDFHQFFDDPRTRVDYLQWAPLLLLAEDFHGGVRSVS